MILQIGDVLISSEIITEFFCCDLEVCKGACCIEGDAGAPVTLDEVGEIEDNLDAAWPSLSAQAQSVIDRHGVAYADVEGELVTSIVNNRDCVFTCYCGDCCMCALERSYREGKTQFIKPISCALYPIREKKIGDTIALNLHRWDICRCAFEKGRKENLRVYQFLKEPLTRRFGAEWYAELEECASVFMRQYSHS